MKKILGLDLGTTSIGWAMVNEKENDQEESSIIKLGVRVNPLSSDELGNFEKGKSITTNADRTLKRSMRRNLQRYKQRREYLRALLTEHHWINSETLLAEVGNYSTFETYRLRAKAATEEISLEELARVLLMINKKRGYKSSRKANSGEDGQLLDGMEVAKVLYDDQLTPGQYTLSLLKDGKHNIPDFYRSDLQNEFNNIWTSQQHYYPDILTNELKEELRGKTKTQTWAICKAPFQIVGKKRTLKGNDLKIENYTWRSEALTQKLELEDLAIVLQEINGQLASSSGYLGNISDRSKELYFQQQTVGQHQMAQLDANPNYSLKNHVYYRQDYLDEFETIWSTQSQFHPELTPELKHEIRDVIIFYQRPLKSQKGLVSFCELESRQIEVVVDGNKKLITTGSKVCPKSSPLFQDFKIWQILNNIMVLGKGSRKRKRINQTSSPDIANDATEGASRSLFQEEKELLYDELRIKDKLSKKEALKLLFENFEDLDLNFENLEGNRTQAALFRAYEKIIELSGHEVHDFAKEPASKTMKVVTQIFSTLGFSTDILTFNSLLDGKDFEMQPAYQLWHLLYSFDGDDSKTGDEKLVKKIQERYGFDKEYAKIIAAVTFQDDYGSLSTKALLKIMPYLCDGHEYSEACSLAGYRHSKRSLTKEELDAKPLCDHLDILPRNSLRNPVVEKILNQMIHVVNGVVDTYGRPDEIRIELARELKKSAKEREEMSTAISKSTKEGEAIRKLLQDEFGIKNPSRNDVLRYKLYKELESTGFKTLYSQTYIPREKIFSKEIDIEHIIPQARLFDDSFSNKTLEIRSINIEKSNATAYDYVETKYGATALEEYKLRVEKLFRDGIISKSKRNKLLMKEKDIPSDFIDRDLRNSQYISKKACEILESLVRTVTTTTGAITDRLREDWGLINVMQELNWDKYDRLDCTEILYNKDGQPLRRIKDWTKRNDHRHHAMDALTIAFTKRSLVQYLNNLNARSDKSLGIYGIEQKELERDSHNKLRFKYPFGRDDEFRNEAKKQLEALLVSQKSKTKVVTSNINKTCRGKGKDKGTNRKLQLTPRGQLHNETIYGSQNRYVTKMEKVNATFDADKIATVASPVIREALLHRLNEFGGDPKKAFTGKNALNKNPIYLNNHHTTALPDKVKTVTLETIYTIRKPVSPDLRVDKVVDENVRRILEDRLRTFGNDPKKAFVNLDENPIWLNQEKGIAIKSVTITGVNNVTALHDKHDNQGNPIIDEIGNKQPVDYVSTGNNHHVAIFCDAEGKLQEHVVSFYEATSRAIQGIPIIDKEYNKDCGWTFLFSMKRNEYFVFPDENTGFNPQEIDLLDPNNYSLISPHLFRVQKITSKDYYFRHHLDTTVDTPKELSGTTYFQRGLNRISNIVKVRINHIGQIVAIGE